MKFRVLLLAASLAAFCAGEAGACGYHLGLTGNTFDVIHPKSLGVAVAVHRATDDGVLKPVQSSTALPNLLGGDYRQAVQQLRALETKLTTVAPGLMAEESLRFTLVFVQSRLWTQYVVEAGSATAKIHTAAADDSEVIVLSDESVLTAITDERLTFDTAVERDLVQVANDRSGKILDLLRAALTGP